ncbi:hypothetical protein TWF718_004189 [Orbilia javanica]|uniref:Uncharacterized protein n=1 Tax=Orbilia javanica TaxID=47235 RepID=A0AAN8RQ47_9PEZI
MTAALFQSLSIYSPLTFLLALTLTWRPTYSQASTSNTASTDLQKTTTNDNLIIALWESTRTVSALGTLTSSNLPTDCFSLGTRSNTGVFSWFQGCDVLSRRSCCPDGYSTGGFYSATECPVGYTPRPTRLDTVRGTPVAYTFSVDRTSAGVEFCCPTPNPRGGWQEYGFFMSDGLMCDWISVDAQESTTLYQRGAASAIVIVSTGTSLPSAVSAGTSGSTDAIGPAETSASAGATADSGGMSNGAIIGISVGVGFPVLAVLGFLIYKFGGSGGKKEEGGENPGVEESGGVGGMMY